MNKRHNDQLSVGLLAQLVKRCTVIAESESEILNLIPNLKKNRVLEYGQGNILRVVTDFYSLLQPWYIIHL